MPAYPFILLSAALALTSCAAPVKRHDAVTAQAAVTAAETAFAASMADRDLPAFASFVSEEAVFFSGERALRGKAAVVEAWRVYFESPDAPFSWAPATVEVLDSGELALSSGPVFDPQGNRVATFTSIWRREGSGAWRVVFDKGCRVCGP